MFFDNIDIDEEDEYISLHLGIDIVKSMLKNEIGDILYYDKNKLQFFAEKPDMYILHDYMIPIGIVVHVYKDLTVDVLIKGFLTKEYIRTPLRYMQPDKYEYITPYIYDLFKRYRSAFIRHCPQIEDIKKLKLRMPGILHLNNILDNIDIITKSLEIIMGHDDAHSFLQRFYKTYIYIIHNKKMYAWYVDTNHEFKISNIDILFGDFLSICSVEYENIK